MSNLSHRQILFRDFLIKRLGFTQDDFLDKFLEALEKASPRYKYLCKQKKVWDEEGSNPKPEKENPFTAYEDKGDYFLPVNFNVIDFLNYELNLKKTKEIKQRVVNRSYITATDISNFTYCPVSFSINRTLEIEKIESAIIGTSQHEKNILLNYIKPFKELVFVNGDYKEIEKQHSFMDYINDNNQTFITELSNTELLYSGHKDNVGSKKYFKNLKGNYFGQPDYIFKNKDTNQIFAVEEKFQFVPKKTIDFYYNNFTVEEENKIQKKRNETYFFQNHINQLNSYIQGIADYDISYGYLVYWKYEIEDGYPKILSCNVLKIEKTEIGNENFKNIFSQVAKTINNNGGQFDIGQRNPFKCSSCVSNVLCGHKTGKYSEFSFPYKLDYLKLTYAEFPDELRKNNGNHEAATL